MNRIYRIVFNRALGVPQVVSELGCALVLMAVASSASAQSCPVSGEVAVSCRGATDTNGGSGAFQNGGSPGGAGSGAGGVAGQPGVTGLAGGAGGAFSGNGGESAFGVGSGGGGGTSGGGGGGSGDGVSSTPGGGGGLAGMDTIDATSIDAGVTVTGGGGATGLFSADGYGGTGGGGAAGVLYRATANFSNAGTIVGGAGGNGGAGDAAGGGGGGGVGLALMGSGSMLVNSGTLAGGRGGSGGSSSVSHANEGGAGDGGAGLGIVGSGNRFTNSGSIVGGNGGSSSALATLGAGGYGVGISGHDNTLATSGSITGGTDNLGQRGDAVHIIGDNNTLQLLPGYSFSGNVFAQAGHGNALQLDGTGTASFDVGSVTGFDRFTKSNTGSWQLTGTTSANTPWLLTGGLLSLASDASLGADSGTLTLDAATVEATGDIDSRRGIAVMFDGGTLQVDNEKTWTLHGGIGGAGTLVKSGAGTLVINGTASNSGGIDIEAGEVRVGSNDATGSIAGPVTTNGRLKFLRGDTTTMAGVISGTGSLDQSGVGTLILTGSNTYTGGTTIANGTLQVGAGMDGSIVGNVTNFGSFVLDSRNALTLGSLAGFGSVVQMGTGTTTITASSPLTGAVSITRGTLALQGSGSLAASSGLTVDNGTFDIGGTNSGATIATLSGSGGVNLGGQTLTLASAHGSYSGRIGGTGGFTLGSGSESFTGSNIYSGVTTINGGTLSVTNGGGIYQTAQVFDNGHLVIDGALSQVTAQDRTFGGSVGNGTIDVSNGGLFFSAGDFKVGGNAGETGTVSVASGSGFRGNNDIDIGASGWGTVAVSGGGSIWAGVALSIGDQAGSLGRVTATGTGTDVHAGVSLVVGNAGSGMLTVSDGATVTASNVNVATSAGSSGSINIGADGASAPGLAPGSLGIDQITFGAGTGKLVFNHTSNGYVLDATIAGPGSVNVLRGTTILTGDNTYTGGTLVQNGTLQLGNGGTSGSVDTSVSDYGTLIFNHSNDITFAKSILGSGSVVQAGTGVLALDGTDTYTGGTFVRSGTLLVGSQALRNTAVIVGDVTVSGGATLGGFGSVTGNVNLASGGILAPGGAAPSGSLRINGQLAMASGSRMSGSFGAPAGDLRTFGSGGSVVTGGDLSLGNVALDVGGDGAFGRGLYSLFRYGGALHETDGGLHLGTVPAGSILSIQRLAAQHQINLVNTGGEALKFWNANGLASASRMGGGSGTWNNTAPMWTDAEGSVTSAMAPQPGFAVFGGDSGVVAVDDSVEPVASTGMQFASSGYLMTGDALTLVKDGDGNAPMIRVGDGAVGGASVVAEIGNTLAGVDGLTKSDLGTLVLSGSNTYTGTTTIEAGTLQIGKGGQSGDIQGDIVDNGNLVFDRVSYRFDGTISGSGDVTAANGLTSFSQVQTYTGVTRVASNSVLLLEGNASISSSSVTTDAGGFFDVSHLTGPASIVSLGGDGFVFPGGNTLVLTHAADTFGGTIGNTVGHGGGLRVAGGTEVLTGANTYTDRTTIDAGATLQIGDGGSTGSIVSDVTVDGTLAFSRNNDLYYAGIIDGTGRVVAAQTDSNNLVLTGHNTYTGGTFITSGVLIGGVDNFGTGAIVNDAVLGLGQDTDGTLTNDISGHGLVVVDPTGQTITFTGHNSYTGGTIVRPGTLVGTTGSLQGSISLDGGSLVFDQATDGSFAGVLDGTGTLAKRGSGMVTVSGDSHAFAGSTEVEGGVLAVDGLLGGNVDVAPAGTLAGNGGIQGDVTVQGGGTIAPGGVRTTGLLTVHGGLAMAQGSTLQLDVGAPGSPLGTPGTSDGVSVDGDLALNGVTVNVNDAGGMGLGLYRVFRYGGQLTQSQGGLAIGNVPAGEKLSIYTLADDRQINLIDATTASINLWNGNGQASASHMGGGSGTWSADSRNWTDASGQLSTPLAPQPGFAVFGGAAGTVTVDDGAGTVLAAGLQFASDGYRMNGDALTLVGSNGAAPAVRVGDGTAQGAAFTATIGNVLAGNAGLEKADRGTLILTGSNTYTGGTTVSAGMLQVGAGGTVGAIAGDVANSGTLAFDRSDNVAFAGAISGTGDLAQKGDGVLTLTATSSFTGDTHIEAGTLALSGQGSLSGSTRVVDDATFDVSQAGNGIAIRSLGGNGAVRLGSRSLTLAAAADTFGGTIDGDGGLVLAGGTEVLTGDNTYAGGTTIQAGTLQVGNGGTTGSIVGPVVDNGSLVFDRSDAIVFGEAIGGTGSVQQRGAGSLTLSGNNTYTGDTVVAAGTLDVAGHVAGRVIVHGGAALVGTGSVGALDVDRQGTVSPGGDGIGSLHVAGDVNLAAASFYRVDATDAGDSDAIMADGTATLGGGTVVSIAAGSHWSAAKRYDILAANAIEGTFGSVSNNFAFLTPALDYDAGHAYLTLSRNDIAFASVAGTANEVHVANAIAGDTGHPLYDAVLPLDAGSARAAFHALAGDGLASARNAVLDDSRFVRDAMSSHLRSDDTEDSVWVSTWTHGGRRDGDRNAEGLRANGSGMLLGVDRQLDAWRVGAVAGSGQLSSHGVDGSGDAHGSDKTIGAYTGADLGPWQLQGGAAHTWYDMRSHRRVGMVGLQESLDGRADMAVTQAFLDGGYRMGDDRRSLTPYFNLARAWIHRDAIHEAGGIAALDVQADGSAMNYGGAGVHVAYAPSASVELHASLGYQHAWGDLRSRDRQRFAGGAQDFTIDGVPLARDTGIADIGMHFALGSKVGVDAGYHGQFASGSKDQGARVTLNVGF